MTDEEYDFTHVLYPEEVRGHWLRIWAAARALQTEPDNPNPLITAVEGYVSAIVTADRDCRKP